ncbi:MAG TPA: MarR family transcriptional regulator [Thermoleophilaceae bacterium]|nr:MarR family transcriptional regulator [Thermoleophilaceae bacterium]
MRSPELHIAQLLGAVVRTMETELYGRLDAAGFDDVRPSHSAVFRHIDPDGSRLTDLAERAQMTKQSLGELVSDLEDRGYLERRRHPSDGRVKIIRLTARGKRSRAAAFRAFREIEAGWGERVGKRRVADLRATLADIAALEARSSARRHAARGARLDDKVF